MKTLRTLLTIILTALTATLPCHAANNDDDNIHITDMTTVYRLNTGKDGRLSSVDISDTHTYSARRTKGTASAIVIYDDDMELRKAKSSAKGTVTDYDQALGNIFYTDSKYCLMKAPVSPGKDATVQFERRNNNPRKGGLAIISEIYDIDKLTVSYVIPVALKDRIDIEGVNLPESHTMTVTETKPGKEWTVTYTFFNLPALKNEEGAPASRHYTPMLRMRGLFDNLADLYTYLHGFTLNPDPDPAQVTALAAKLTGDLTDPMDKISAINDWVHENIRYIAVEHGEWGHRPASPSEVIRKRFGDCKGSASLTKALLCATGFDARLVWIGSTAIPERWDEVPLLSTGNHMIACVMLPDRDEPLFIDGTASYCPVRYVPYGINGKQGLIEDGDTYRLADVPQIDPRAHTDSLEYSLILSDSLRLTGSLRSCRTGLSDHLMRDRLKNLSATDRTKFINRLARADRTNFKVSGQSADSTGVIRATVDASSALSQLDGRVLIDLNMFPSLRSDLTCNMKDRIAPFEVSRPRSMTETFIITLPAGASVELPSNAILDTPWAEGTLTYTVDGNTLTATATCVTKGGIVPLESLSDFNTQIRKFASALAANIILTRK